MRKSDTFTSINGRKINQVFFTINITVLIIMIVLRYLFTINFTFDTGDEFFDFYNIGFIGIVGLVPQLMVAFIYSYQAFNKEYFAISKYYQISLFETLKYYLSEVYSKRNLLVSVGGPLLAELIYFLFTGHYEYEILTIYVYGYLLSIGVIFVSFYLTTLHKKWHIIFKIIVPFFLYITTMIGMFSSIRSFHWWYLLIVIGIDLVLASITLLLLFRRQKRMEV